VNCSNCGKPAQFYKKTAEGVVVALCEDCYRKRFGVSQSAVPSQEATDKICSVCGTTLADFRRTGYLGCEACYRVFRSEILAVVRTVQKRTCHEGKQPLYPLVVEQNKLKTELECALSEKRFVDAEALELKLKEISRSVEGIR